MAINSFFRPFTTGVLVTAILISGCSQPADNAEAIRLTASSINNGQLVISTDQLSDRIIKQRNDYVLYDIRNNTDFEAGHIKTAQSASVSQLMADTNKLPRGKDMLVYSANGEQAAQLATLLHLQGINAFYLSGGYSQWQQQMTDAEGSASTEDEARQLAKQQAVSCWFEGDYVATAGLVPKVQPAQQAGGYVPPLEPVMTEEASDDLGLGLGLGLGPEDIPAARGKLNIGEGC